MTTKKLFSEKRTKDTTSILKRATFVGAPMDANMAKSKWWLKLLKVSSFNHWLLKFKVGEAARINGRLKHKAGRLSLPCQPHPTPLSSSLYFMAVTPPCVVFFSPFSCQLSVRHPSITPPAPGTLWSSLISSPLFSSKHPHPIFPLLYSQFVKLSLVFSWPGARYEAASWVLWSSTWRLTPSPSTSSSW